MNTAFFFRPALLACAAAGFASARNACAQEFNQPEDSGYYFRLGPATRFGVKASINANRPVLPEGVYDNGFVLPDIGGPDSGFTWNWGYQSAGQIQGNNLVFSRYDNVPATKRLDADVDSPLFGGEIIGGIDIFEFTMLERTAKVSVELGYGFSSFSSDLSASTTGPATYTVRNHPFGIILPQPPYSGTFDGPGPLIGLDPSSQSIFSSSANTVFKGSLEAYFHELRLGPALTVPLNGRISLGLSVGYSAVLADTTFRYNETTTFTDPSVPDFSSRADINKAKWSPGAYAELRAAYQINRHLSAYLGADVAYHKDVVLQTRHYEANLDLGSTYGLKLGLGYRF